MQKPPPIIGAVLLKLGGYSETTIDGLVLYGV